MTTPKKKKLEDIASDLDDISVTLEEIKDESTTHNISDEAFDRVQIDIERAADAIEETLDPTVKN
ncbi:MAG TPA: hypothetical protein VNJ03_07500 [Vicinamibacterales bacterium]|nr:hypothetical protein [Vicinamibacterales bacterium]